MTLTQLARLGARITAAALALVAALSCATTHPTESISLLTPTGRRVAVDSLTISYDVGGLRVIQRPSYANDVVAIDLYLIGGLQEVTPSTAGIEAVALRATAANAIQTPSRASPLPPRGAGSSLIPRTIGHYSASAASPRNSIPVGPYSPIGFSALRSTTRPSRSCNRSSFAKRVHDESHLTAWPSYSLIAWHSRGIRTHWTPGVTSVRSPK
jgi:hypothetical protein